MDHAPWLSALRRYLIASVAGHAAWEVLQLPLFTLWREGTPRQIAFATLHCLAGDLVIATSVLVAMLAFVGKPAWPRVSTVPVALGVLLMGTTYTAWSEFNNAIIKQTWSYTDAMPLVPMLKVGVTPILQWLLVPALALWAASGALPTQPE
jgi:hypothetical protein